jgi:hypothetical protein
MSYFHTGTRTIIGAEAFHCPVRDGKEWDHLAMVIRLELVAHLINRSSRLIHRIESASDDCAPGITIDEYVKVIGSSLTSN